MIAHPRPKEDKWKFISNLVSILFIITLPLLLLLISKYAGLYVITVNYSGETIGIAYCTSSQQALNDAFRILARIMHTNNTGESSKEFIAANIVRIILRKIVESTKNPFIYGCIALARVTLPALEKLYAVDVASAKTYELLVKLEDHSYLVVIAYDETVFLLAPLSAIAMAIVLFKALNTRNSEERIGKGYSIRDIQLLLSATSYILVLLLIFSIMIPYIPKYYLQLYIIDMIIYSISASIFILALKDFYMHIESSTRLGRMSFSIILSVVIAVIIFATALQIGVSNMLPATGTKELSPEVLTLTLTIALFIPLQVMEKAEKNPELIIRFLKAALILISLAIFLILIAPYIIQKRLAPLVAIAMLLMVKDIANMSIIRP